MKIDHLGIAVKNLDESLKFYHKILGLHLKGIEEVKEQKVRVAFLPIGDSKFELLEPTDSESPIAKHIEKRGQGIQHIALRVKDIEAEIERLKKAGVQFIGDKPTPGAGGAKIIFIHPKSTNGVLLELCERPE
ncbi:methylmalonyl-CoA epimerase [Anoxybacter fermentans]|nr:methylmalonyl-CoA epimerase [Anoxybacter fermentans]